MGYLYCLLFTEALCDAVVEGHYKGGLRMRYFNWLVYIVEFCDALWHGVWSAKYGKGRFNVRASGEWGCCMAKAFTFRGFIQEVKSR